MTTRAGTHENSKDEYGTPYDFFKPLKDAVNGFDLDPAAGAETHETADTRYTGDDTDGLEADWFGTVWLNPPFSEKSEWYDKMLLEHAKGHTDLILAIAPENTADGWWHEFAPAMDMVCFVDGRVSFDHGPSSPPGGIQLWALFGGSDWLRKSVESELRHKGEVWEP